MGFWKLVAAIVVGNLLTALVVTLLWLLFIASLLSSAFNPSDYEDRAASNLSSGTYLPDQRTQGGNTVFWPSPRGELSAPDASGCIKELAEETGGHC